MTGTVTRPGIVERRWVPRRATLVNPSTLAESAGVSEVVAGVLAARGVELEAEARALLSPSLEQLHDPFLMLGMRESVARVLRAVDAGERILVYGDYDVDGTTGTVVLRRALSFLGAKTGYHVPHRFTEGYGIRRDVLERAKGDGYSLVISVDCGIRAFEPLEWARANGLDVIITDVPAHVGLKVRLTPPFGRALDAEVNGVWTEGEDGRQHIGVRLLDPNGWFAE